MFGIGRRGCSNTIRCQFMAVGAILEDSEEGAETPTILLGSPQRESLPLTPFCGSKISCVTGTGRHPGIEK